MFQSCTSYMCTFVHAAQCVVVMASHAVFSVLAGAMPFGIGSKHDPRVTAKYNLREVIGK